MVRLIQDVQSGQPWRGDLSGVIASLVLPYVPGTLAILALERWQYDAYARFVRAAASAHQSRCDLWPEAEYNKELQAVLSSEAPHAFEQFLGYFYSSFACSLNVLFNVAVIGALIAPPVLVAFAGGALLGLVLLRLSRARQSRNATRAQQARIAATSGLASFRDDVLIGNRRNVQQWSSAFWARFDAANAAALRSAATDQAISLTTMIGIGLPLVLAMVHQISASGDRPQDLAALVVTLPRIFSILGFSYSMLDGLTRWPGQRARLSGVLAYVTPPAALPLAERVRWSSIDCVQGDLCWTPSPARLEAEITKPARITVRGPNGAGKTSLLLLLKERSPRAFYLPPAHALSFDQADPRTSTGERVRAVLEAVLDEDSADPLLLDEWDANLDEANERRLSRLIADIATRRPVVEVRHRR